MSDNAKRPAPVDVEAMRELATQVITYWWGREDDRELRLAKHVLALADEVVRLDRIVTNIEVYMREAHDLDTINELLASHILTLLKQDGRGLDIEQEPPHA